MPLYNPDSAACFDFPTRETITIAPGQIGRVKTGLFISVPPGYLLAIVPRSSMPRRGLEMPHSFGVVDPTYCGPKDEILIQVRNVTDQLVEIKKGDRIAQGFFVQTPRVTWHEVDKETLSAESRGGFGSTG